MSLQLKFNIMLHVKSFRNINLYNQGNYYAEFKFFYQMESVSGFVWFALDRFSYSIQNFAQEW